MKTEGKKATASSIQTDFGGKNDAWLPPRRVIDQLDCVKNLLPMQNIAQ